MGWTAGDVGKSSIWHFFACWHGHVEANTTKEPAKLSDAEADELFDWIDRPSSSAQLLNSSVYVLEGRTLVLDQVKPFRPS